MDGYLLIDKPEGISSFGVVARVRRVISEALGIKVKIGHTGTLDPAASGLLILVIGKYTKKAEHFSKLDKKYIAELTLGLKSTTADKEGELTQISTHKPTLDEIKSVLNTFVGEIMQKPPAFSAIKVNGQRAYKLARSGKAVDIEPRKVRIYSLTKVEYDYPELKFEVQVSSGTYIRSLAEDIGAKLNTGAYLSNLKRTSVGVHNLKGAISIDNLEYDDIIKTVKQIPQT